MTIVNPYQSPAEVHPATQRTSDPTRIFHNIRAVCVLYIIFGGMSALGAIGVLLVDGALPAFDCFALVLIVGGIIPATALLRGRTWCIPFLEILSAIYLLIFPVGTILGGYFLLNIGKVKDDIRRETPLSP